MPRLIDADAMRQEWLENGENEYIYDTNAVLDSIDAQPTVSRWIPVTERLPEEDVNVLVAFDDGFIATTCIIDGEWELWADAGEVTHWMPLPDAPKEGY